MKLVVFIMALCLGAGSLLMVNQFTANKPPSTPVLVANIGMDYREMLKRSTLDIGEGAYDDGNEIDGDKYANRDRLYSRTLDFDWEVAGTGLRFAGCKFYWMKTGRNDDPHLIEVKVTTAQKKLTYAELKAEMLTIQERILADGWKPARYEDGRTADVSLRQELEAAKPGSDGNYGAVAHYAKGDVVMTFFGLQLYTDPLIVKDPMRQDIFYHRIELEPRSERTRKWGGDFFPQ